MIFLILGKTLIKVEATHKKKSEIVLKLKINLESKLWFSHHYVKMELPIIKKPNLVYNKIET